MILISALLIYCSVYVYIALLLSIITIENYYFLKYYLKYLLYKRMDEYNFLEISKKDLVQNTNSIVIILEILKIGGFKRLYFLINKKKSIKILFIALFIYWAHIPVRFLKYLKYFIQNRDKSFKTCLFLLYHINCEENKDKKIEFLNKVVYLNCTTFGKLLLELSKKDVITGSFRSYKKQDYMSCFVKLKEITRMKEVKEFKEFKLQSFKIDEYSRTSDHYTYEEKGNTMHATSNVPDRLKENQSSDYAIGGLIKYDSYKPGTVITKNVKQLGIVKNTKFIQKDYVDVLKSRNPDTFDLDKESLKQVSMRREKFENCIGSLVGKSDISKFNKIITSLELGHYDNVLNNLDTLTMDLEIDRHIQDLK